MVNLDQLLDNDKLTLAQERVVRRLFNYEIKRVENYQIDVYYSLKDCWHPHIPFSYRFNGFFDLKERYYSILCQALVDYIKTFASKVENENLIKELINTLENACVKPENAYSTVKFKDNNYAKISSLQYMKMQPLFKVAQMIHNETKSQ